MSEAECPAGGDITVVGFGAGQRRLLTIEVLEVLRTARRLYIHASGQALIDELTAAGDLPAGLAVEVLPALDDLADTAPILQQLLDAGEEQAIVYATPGHPFAEPLTVPLLSLGGVRGMTVHVVAGLGRVEYGTVPLAPLGSQVPLQVVPAREIVVPGDIGVLAREQGLQRFWQSPSMRLLDAQMPLVIDGNLDPAALTGVAEWLRRRYPPDHQVSLLYQGRELFALEGQSVPLSTLDSTGQGPAPRLDEGATLAGLFVPPLEPLDDVRALTTLGYITARLRAPDGCPWDREQTHATLTRYMIEEAYEAVDAIERDDTADMVEELGDVLLQVVLHSQLAEEAGRFSLLDVVAEVNSKLVRRHPHVFGSVTVRGADEVLDNWEAIKRREKGARRSSALDGVLPALPALTLAQTVGRKAAKLGFDWPDVAGALDKAREELDEIAGAKTPEERREEIGDLLFALTSVCRHLDLDAEDALRAAVRKFSDRFRRVERDAAQRALDLATMSMLDLDALWQAAKADG